MGMRHIVDITKDNFDRVDFSEARIVDFYCQRCLPSSFEFTVWGATIWFEPRWDHFRVPIEEIIFYNGLPCKDDMYVSGIGTIRMERLVGGYIEIYPYEGFKDAKQVAVLAKNQDGTEVIHKRAWNLDDVALADEYLWELSMVWPQAACNLYLYSDNGEVSFEFDDSDMVKAEHYIHDPHRYAYKDLYEPPVTPPIPKEWKEYLAANNIEPSEER
jgi:hypothetical protein